MNEIISYRAQYIVPKYKEFLKGKILDIGCRNKDLKRFLDRDAEYTGLDIAREADLIVDLDKEKIPFPDNSFDCVVCFDVLEHLENIHLVFDEIIRVSSKYAIISLPNCYAANFFKIITGRGGTRHYGLPSDPIKDRHRWFFNYQEAKDFILERVQKNKAEIIDFRPFIRKKPIRNFFLRIIYGRNYENIASLCIFALIKK